MEELPRYMYHGTLEKEAQSILISGFKERTYFTRYLDSALVMGGPYVFKVWFTDEEHLNRGKCWEYISPIIIDVKKIIWLRKFSNERLWFNEEAEKEGKKCWLKNTYPDKELCEECGGRGQIENHDEYACQWKLNLKVTLCKRCNGYGVKNRF